MTGPRSAGYEDVVGPFGAGNQNNNSSRLLSLCSSHGLIVSGSWFRRLDVHRWTWASDDGRTKKEIDHIITTDIRSIKSYRVFRSTEAPANTDHFLTVAKYAVQPQFKHRLKCTRRFDTGKLRHDLTTASAYTIAISNRFEALAESGQSLGTNWRKPPGRPRKTWIQQNGNGTPASWRQMWQSADERGHREESSQRTSAVYASWRWWCEWKKVKGKGVNLYSASLRTRL